MESVKVCVYMFFMLYATTIQDTTAVTVTKSRTTESPTADLLDVDTSSAAHTDIHHMMVDWTTKPTNDSTSNHNMTGPLQDFFSLLGKIFGTVTNSSTEPSVSISAMAMQKKLPKGLQNSLLPFLVNAKPLDLQNVFKLFSGLAPKLPSLLKGVLHMNTSMMTDADEKCFEDMKTFSYDLLKGKMWALKMLDASGKPGPSILDGNLKFLGNFDECLDVTSSVITTRRPVKGDTCVVSLSPPSQMISLLGAPQGAFGALDLKIAWHLCVPSTCNGGVVQKSLKQSLSVFNIKVATVVCHADIKNGPIGSDSKAVGAIVLIAILGSLVLLGSALDLNIRVTKGQSERQPRTPRLDAAKLHDICTKLNEVDSQVSENSIINENHVAGNESGLKKVTNGDVAALPNGKEQPIDRKMELTRRKPNNPIWQRMLLCFSAITNGEKILSVKHTPGSLTCLNGIRVLSIGWVIMGHTFLFLLNIADNPASAAKLTKRLSFQIMINGTLAVDSFFVLSGLLVTYLFLRETEKAGGIKVKNMILYYVHRYLRLTPAYAFIIFIYTTLVRYFADAPGWSGPTDTQWCLDNWWTNILYINNLYKNDEMCLAWGWYLANDMQFYIVAPMALIPFALGKNRRLGTVMKTIGICLTLGFIVTSIVSTAVLTYNNPGDVMHNNLEFFNNVYQKPWCRISPFAIGMGLGYFLHVKRCKMHMATFFQGLGWFLALVLAGACTLSTYDEMAEGRPAWGAGAIAAHEALYRPGWGLVLAWVILMCCTGKGGLVNWMLSWDWWQPLARLTYGAYLIHLIIILIYAYTARTLIHYTADYMVLHLFGYACLSYIFAFILAILVEAPLIQLEKLLLSK